MLNETKIYDPVCGMEIKDVSGAETVKHKGTTYYFCSDLCKIKFEEHPEKYAGDDPGGEDTIQQE